MKRTLTKLIAIVMAAFMAFAVVPGLIKAGSAVKASIDSKAHLQRYLAWLPYAV